MDFKKWETIVVEWVNCLKISEPVKSLQDLRNGLFFSSLLELLTPEESVTTETSLTAILTFLKSQYQNFSFQHKDEINFDDLVEVDLLVISSLLLHYSCIYDRRDTLTSPLCQKLSKMTQICIRAFLENISPEITKDQFFETIEQCISKSKPKPVSTHTLSPSPLPCRSPLQDLLRTPLPTKMVRLQEKDKEINKLRAEIDLERFEKIDLQDELLVQKERNKKLSKQMSDKTAEIVKLRSEIADLENKSLPHFQDNEARELQQRLRGEINSLEQYVAQLQGEQEQLYNERDSIKDKLRKVEGQSTIWHDKAIASENDLDDLLEKHQQQETELQSLRAHCMELSALLEEYHSLKRSTENSIEVDTSTAETSITSASEEFACAVIEVQFKEVQKENAELNAILRESQQNSKKLNEELNSLKATYEGLQSNYQILKEDNETLLEKVTVLSETEMALQNTREELEQSVTSIHQLTKCNESLSLEIDELQKQLNETSTTLAVANCSNDSLTKNLKNLKSDFANMEVKLKAKTENCCALEDQVCKIQAEYNELFDNYTKTNFNLQSLTETLHLLEHDMEESLQKLEKFVFGDNYGLDFKDWNVTFTKLFSQLEDNFLKETNKKKALMKEVSDFEGLVLKLRADLELLNNRESVNLQERQTLCTNLECAEQKVLELENVIASHEEKIIDLNSTISKMSMTIDEYEKIKQIVDQKENLISDLEAVNRSLELKLSKSNEELKQSKILQEDLQKSLQSLEYIRKDFEVKVADYEKKLEENKENEESLCKSVEELKALTCVFEEEIAAKSNELQECKDNEVTLQQTLEDLKYQLFEANNKISRQQSTIELLETTNFNKENQYQESIKCLNNDIGDFQAKINNLEMDLQSSKVNYSLAQKDLENILNVQRELQEELETCKSEYNKRSKVLEATISKLEQDLQGAGKEQCELQKLFDAKSEECSSLKLERSRILAEQAELAKKLDAALENMEMKGQHCNELDDLVSKNRQELLVAKSEAEQQRQHLEALNDDIAERNVKIQELELQVSSIDVQNTDLRQKISELEGEYSLLQNLKEHLEKKCEELEANSWKIVTDLSSKNDQLDELVKKYKEYQEKSENEISELRVSLTHRLTELETLKETKNTLMIENQKEIDALQNTISSLNQEIKSLNIQEVQFVDEIRSTKDELSDTIKKYTEALQAKQELEAESEMQVNNLTENLHELIEKYNNLDKSYAETIFKLNDVQKQLDVLEIDKVQLEVNMLEQKAAYEDEYSKCSADLNLQIQELKQRESSLSVELNETIQKLKTSEADNDNLTSNFKKMCAEFAQLKDEKYHLYEKLSHFDTVCKQLKGAFSSLKHTHTQFLSDNCQNLNELKVQLVQEIRNLCAENEHLKDSVRKFEDNLKELQTEQQLISATHAEKLNKNAATEATLKKEIKMYLQQIEVIVEEKKILEEQIASERALFNEQRKKFEENSEANARKMEEYKTTTTELQCAKRILEASTEILQKEVEKTIERLQKVEEAKLSAEQKYTEEIEIREDEIGALRAKIDTLQIQVLENANKNNELIMELCNVNESLESLTNQHVKLQQVLSEEQESFSKKLLEVETESTNKQNLLENLQVENQNLNQEISLAKSEAETLKEKLKTYLMERQALELKIQAANEKLLGQDSVIRRHESAISEANSKLLQKLEEILDLEKAKRNLQEKVEELGSELDKAKRSRDDIMETQAKLFKDTENNLIRAHESATEAKNDLLKRLELMENEKVFEKQLRCDIERLLDGEKMGKEILEIRMLELTNERSKYLQLFSALKQNIRCLSCVLSEKPVEILTGDDFNELNLSDIENLNLGIDVLREEILKIMQQNQACINEISELENQKSEITHRIEQAVNEKTAIAQEKEQLLNHYNILCNEKAERDKELEQFNAIQIAHEILTAKYEQLQEFARNSENGKLKNTELEQKIINLERKTAETYNVYKKFAGHSITYKIAIEKLITERNVLEGILNNIRRNLASVQTKILHVSDDREHARIVEQLQAFEVITEDIQKQFARVSKKIHDIILTIVVIPGNVYDAVVGGNTKKEELFEEFNFDDELERVIDCRDRASDLLEQVTAFKGVVSMKLTKPQKENILRTSNSTNIEVKVKDEELKKRNTMLKQRLTLAENAKSNLEKKIKQLRQENKTIIERTDSPDNDFAYKTLLQQHIQAKEDYEKTLNECKAQYHKLQQEHEAYKTRYKFIPEQIRYEKELKTEHDVKRDKEIAKLREAYGNLMSDNSKLDLENVTMRKLLEDRTSQLGDLKVIKEAYEKLLEENNKLKMELDTLKYKRNRDREELAILQNDRDEGNRIQEVRNEYEAKLEKMKNKMIQLYKEEFDKEAQKHRMDQSEKVMLLKTIEQLKHSLREAKLDRSRTLDLQNLQNRDFGSCSSGESFFLSLGPTQTQNVRVRESLPITRNLDEPISDKTSVTRRRAIEDRKCATLPKSVGMSVIEEDAVLRRSTLNSVPPALGRNIEMEDEDDDMFNNKYLADLKEGRCVVPTGRESNANRLSELKWRNSLCPPHLKSSYPAETQFNSPGQFKEEDLKTGIADFDDSMSTRLIPGEKPRKKDIGTTSYKKPGPPTPSKNGGRVSLQGNEFHLRDLARDPNESKTPKRSTPSRLKALFMGRNSSVRDNSESQPATPRSKRLSIFRKPK